MKKALVASILVLLVLPAVASAYSVHRYRVWDAGSEIRHAVTVCKDRYDLVHRFEFASRVETADGADRRIRYSRYTVRRGCRRLVQWYPDVPSVRGLVLGPCQGKAAADVDDAQQRTDRELAPYLKPRLELFPAAGVHADLATASALAAPNQQRATTLIEIAFGERESFPDAQPGAPHDDDEPA
jgi:hypothetical protein